MTAPPGIAEVLLPAPVLRARVEALAAEIAAAQHGSEPLVLVCVLKGSTLFTADLVRALTVPLEIEFMSISSYGQGATASGVVRIVKDLDRAIAGRDVVIVEDIVDTGLTLNYLRRTLGQREPRSLSAVTLLDKSARRIVPVPLEHAGFDIPDAFVVGYGMDFQGRYRNLPDILAVTDLPRLANEPLAIAQTVWPPSRPGG